MECGALQHALESERGLRLALDARWNVRRRLIEKLRQFPLQGIDICAAGPEDIDRDRIVEHRQQQVLDRDEFVALLVSHPKRGIQRKFEFFA